MNEKEITDWKDFEGQLKDLREEHRKSESSPGPRPSQLLFRGQENSCWPLTTTLERPPDGREEMPFGKYYVSIHDAKHEIESFTGENWALPDLSVLEKLMAKYGSFFATTEEENKPWCQVFSYMVHLRHHGSPSPLLDWTRSPYVAGFFAFRRAIKDVKKVSVYVYCEMPKPKDHRKASSSNRPEIKVLQLKTRTHRRHFLQQCEYTICEAFREEWRFAPHEEVFARGDPNHDVHWKFNIPSTERPEVLKLLDNDYNINAFSLFGSEESLMETMALRELDFRLP